MFKTKLLVCLLTILFISSCAPKEKAMPLLGHFNSANDLFLAQFDCKTDTDDLHSVAGVATMLADPRFAQVKYHAVAGAYGVQEGLYVPPNPLFQAAFEQNWSDAHGDFDKALQEVSKLVSSTLDDGGSIWIAEAGQSDFSAALVKNIQAIRPDVNTKKRIHIVQHSDWNEQSAAPENLAFVKANTAYHKIPDGNRLDNGSPGFYSEDSVNWQSYITSPKLATIWNLAIEIANKYNGKEDRHNNQAIAKGGLDFSDVSETCWIFGFDQLRDANAFFAEFSAAKK